VKRFVLLGTATVVLGLALLGRALITSAHASLVSSNPTDKQVLATAPASVTMTFTDNLSPAPGSFILVTNNGNDVSNGPATINKSDTKSMTLPLKANLPAGQYDVFWKSTSADDGGVTFGRMIFFVGQTSAADVATAQPGAAVAVPDAAKSQAISGGSKSSSNTGWIVGVVVAAIAGLVIGAGAIALPSRRSR
jgi:methionine-rich copper-binding protein CopC